MEEITYAQKFVNYIAEDVSDTLNNEVSILTECRDICNRIYIARNITMNADEIEEQMRRIDRLLREPNWN
jgi:DNA polymerase II large subunit